MMSHYDTAREIECIRNLYNMGVEGIVLCAVNNGSDFQNFLKLLDVPIVAIGNRIDGIPFVGVDDFVAMQDMTKYALAEGKEQIIYFSPALNHPDAYAQRLRYEGFLSTIGNKAYSVVTDIGDIKETYDKPTAVICSNDYYAMQVYFKAKNVTVFGFDNIKAIYKFKLAIDSMGYSMADIATAVTDTLKTTKNKAR